MAEIVVRMVNQNGQKQYTGNFELNLVKDILERALEVLKPTHVYIRNNHARCDQFYVRSHAFERRSLSYSQALKQELSQ